MSRRTEVALVAAALGAMAGMRSMSAPAVVTTRYGSTLLKWASRAMALGELVADKTETVPNRIEPMPLAGRIFMGGACAAVVAHAAGTFVVGATVIGAATAAGSAHLFYRLRKEICDRTGLPDMAVAIGEDALVAATGARILSSDLMSE